MTSLLILLGVVLCSLGVQSNLPGFKELQGKWYEVGITSDKPGIMTEKRSSNVGTVTIKQKKNGDFDFTHETLNDDGSCRRQLVEFKKNDHSPHFMFTDENPTRGDAVIVGESDIKEYAIFHIRHMENGHYKFNTTVLYARSPEPSEELKEKWKFYIGFTSQKIKPMVFLPNKGECKAA